MAFAERGGAAQCQSFSWCLFYRWCAEWINAALCAAKTPFLKACTANWRLRWAQSQGKWLRWADCVQPTLTGLSEPGPRGTL